MNKFLKVLLIMLCAVVLVVLSVAGTLAWLSARTQTATNTFTAGDISITLVQNTVQTDTKIVPGKGYTVDPVVTVNAGSEDCYLFVKIDTPENFNTIFTYTIATGWLELAGTPGVYYREVKATDTERSFAILLNNSVAVQTDVTKANFNNLNNGSLGMNFTAYAVQSFGLTNGVTQAWEIAKNLAAPTTETTTSETTASETTTSGTPEQVEEEVPSNE